MSASEQEGGSAGGQPQGKVTGNVHEDEINLLDCMLILVKHKWLILLGTFLPGLLVGTTLCLLPVSHTVSYTYRMAMGELDLKLLQATFYSAENIARLVGEFGKRGLDEHARALTNGRGDEHLKRLVNFEIVPSLLDIRVVSLEEYRRKYETKGAVLILHVRDSSAHAMRNVADVYRDNFESVIPLYLEKEKLARKVIGLKRDMAAIEESRHMLNIRLQQRTITLGKLKDAVAEAPLKSPDDIVLEFNIGSDIGISTYLPLPYQIEAVQTQIINLEEDVRTNVEKYACFADLLEMNESLLKHLDAAMQQRFTLKQLHSFLVETLAGCSGDTPHLKDDLAAYIKQIENEMTAAAPVSENPIISATPRAATKKAGVVLIVALLLSIIGAFVYEGLQKRQ